jgi:hypothetical protein
VSHKLLDVVTTLVDMPKEGIAAGTTGTIVDLYADGEVEVEFANERGETLAMLTFAPDQIQLRPPSAAQSPETPAQPEMDIAMLRPLTGNQIKARLARKAKDGKVTEMSFADSDIKPEHL